jgi:hypothetical protein
LSISFGEGEERMLEVSSATIYADPMPAFMPGEMRGLVKPAELAIANQPSSTTVCRI